MGNNDIIISTLQNLPKNKIALFGISCVDRLLYMYNFFVNEISDEYNSELDIFKKGYSELSYMLNQAINSVLDESCTQYNFQECSEKCLIFAPDTECISSVYAVIAQNCAIALSYVFIFLLNENVESIYYCRSKISETIDIISFSKNEEEEVLNSTLDNENTIEYDILNKIIQFSKQINTTEIELLREIDKQNRILP